MRRFTPRVAEDSDERLELDISEDDYDRAHIGPRESWQGTVTDLQTGRSFLVRSAPCGLGCWCDAVVVREVEPVRH